MPIIWFGKPHKAPLKAKLAKEYVLHSAHKNKTKTTLPKERQPVTSGLNASRGALYRLNFCAKFGFGSRINGSAKIPCLRQAATTLCASIKQRSSQNNINKKDDLTKIVISKKVIL